MKKTTFVLGLLVIIQLTGCINKADNTKQSEPQINDTTLEKAKLVGNETIATPYGTITLEHNYITQGADELYDAMDFQRASQAYIWSTPIVSMKTWQIQQDLNYKTAPTENFCVLVSLKEKRGIVTGNLTTPYIFSFYNLKEKPIVVDYPAGASAGGFLDLWQRPVIDVGFTGPDQTKGAKYMIVGPEDDISKYKSDDYSVYQSATNNLFLGIRILETEPAKIEAFKASMKVGYYGDELKTVKLIENLDKEWSATAPRGLEYWKTLKTILDEEPVREQDKAWTAMLEPLGIAKGEVFNPSEREVKILSQGAAMGELMLRNMQTKPRFAEVYWEGTNWFKSFDFTIPQITDYKVELDERAVWFYEAVTSTEGMVNPTPGKGQVYMTVKRDSDNNLFRADKTYKLTVPKDVPVAQFWSVALYSEQTRRPYDNGGTELEDVALNSRMEHLQYNKDGSVDLYIGAKAPEGMESNFLKTVGQDGWFIYFRLYAPTEPFFDKSFSLPDFEVVEE